jgi:hypothetical protein
VLVFAEDVFAPYRDTGVERLQDEVGLGGICLAPEFGYVFATFVAPNDAGQLVNHLYRFETGTPGTFSVKPTSGKEITNIFETFPTGPSHQIGNCAVDNDALIVGVGDGFNRNDPPINLAIPQGKILRFTLDGKPHTDNPFYDITDPTNLENYVLSFGFRNPFGISIVDDQVFIAENGVEVDRFFKLSVGEDYLWDGSDFSIGAKGDAIFRPTIGPAQMVFVPEGNRNVLDQDSGAFYIGSTSKPVRGLIVVHYDFQKGEVSQPPEQFLAFIGNTESAYYGVVPAVGLGADGIYFAPIVIPNLEHTNVYRIHYDPANEHLIRPDTVLQPEALLSKYSCTGCHVLNGEGNSQAPSLENDELTNNLNARLNSDAYIESLDSLDLISETPYPDYKEQRDEIRSLVGTDDLLSTWMVYHLMEPKFDTYEANMPNFGLTQVEAELLTEYLLTPSESDQPPLGDLFNLNASFRDNVKKVLAFFIPTPGYRELAYMFAAGLAAGVAVSALVWFLRSRKNKSLE